MSIRFNCQFCDAVMKIPDSMAGSQGTCPSCKRTVIAPMASSPEPPTYQAQLNAQSNPVLYTDATAVASAPSSMSYTSQNISQQPAPPPNYVQNVATAVPTPSFCSKCGNQLISGSRVCTNCGTPIASAPSTPPYSPQNTPQPVSPPPNILPRDTVAIPSTSFCSRCGNPLVPGGRVCTNCGTPAATGAIPASVQSVTNARQYYDNSIWQTFLTFISNPISGIKLAFDNLEGNKASNAGLMFGLSFVALTIMGVLILLQSTGEYKSLLNSIGITEKNIISSVLFLGLFTFGCLLVSIAIVRALFGGEGAFGGVVFFTGATLLPLGISIFIGAILSFVSPVLILFVLPFLFSHAFLTMYGGLRYIFNITEEKVTYALPVLLIVWTLFQFFVIFIMSLILLAGAASRGFNH